MSENFGGGGSSVDESRLIRSILHGKLEARLVFIPFFKGPSSQDQQQAIRRRLVTSKVTLASQSHFMLIFVHFKVALPNCIKSVPSDLIESINCVH